LFTQNQVPTSIYPRGCCFTSYSYSEENMQKNNGAGPASRPIPCPVSAWVADDAFPHCQLCSVEWKSASIGSETLLKRCVGHHCSCDTQAQVSPHTRCFVHLVGSAQPQPLTSVQCQWTPMVNTAWVSQRLLLAFFPRPAFVAQCSDKQEPSLFATHCLQLQPDLALPARYKDTQPITFVLL
jgi:hypothetical protein